MPHLGNVFHVFRVGTRFRVLAAAASIDLKNDVSSEIVVFPALGQNYSAKTGGLVTAPGSTPLSPATMEAVPGVGRHCGWTASVNTGFGDTDVDDQEASYIVPPGGFGSPSAGDNEGHCEAEVIYSEVQTWAVVYFMDEGVGGADGSSTWGGVQTENIVPRSFGIRFYEVAPAGSTVTATMAITAANGVNPTATATSTLASDYVFDHYAASLLVYNIGCAGSPSHNGGGSGTLEGDWALIGPGSTVSASDQWTTVTIAGNSVSLAIATDADNPDILEGAAKLGGEPNREFKTHAHAYALDQDYPGSLTLGVQGVPAGQTSSVAMDPDGEFEFVQRTYVAEAILSEGEYSIIGLADDWENVRTYVTNASLVAAGEDPKDWVTEIWGRKYDALRILQSENHSAGTPVQDGSEWGIAYTPLPGNYGGYRYLRVRLKTDADGETVTLTTDSDPGKTHTITTSGTAFAYYLVDLCFPDSPTPDDNPELDDDTPFPIRNDGLKHLEKAGEGVGRVREITLSGGTNLDVDAIDLHREQPALLDCMPAFLDLTPVQTEESYAADGSVGGVPIIQASRGVAMTTDGRRSLIWEVVRRQLFETIDGPIWVYSYPTCTDFESGPRGANSTPGIVVDHPDYVPSDAFHALDGTEAANLIDGGDIYLAGWLGFLLGGGVIYDGYTPTNQLGKSIGGTAVDLPMQVRFHEICVFPGAGEVWTDGDYNEPTPVRVAKIMRAAVDGLVLDAPAGQLVRLLDDAATVSSGTTDSHLKLRMAALPYGKGQREHSVVCGAVQGDFTDEFDEGDSQTFFNARRWHRVVFRPFVPTGTGSLHLARATFDGAILETAASDGTVTTKTFNLGGAQILGSVGAGDSAQSYIRPSGDYLSYRSTGGETIIAQSLDQGETWEDADMDPIPGTLPAVVVNDATGEEFVATWTDPGWDLYRMLPGEDEFSLVTHIADGPERQAGLVFKPTDDGALTFSYDTGSGTERLFSRNQGEDWTNT